MDIEPDRQREPAPLAEGLTDPELLAGGERAERRLAGAAPLDRLRFLRLLGRLDEAREQVQRMLADVTGAADASGDTWQLLLQAADVFADSADVAAAERLRVAAWRQALTRDQQASTLHRFALRDVHTADPNGAAAKLQLALALRRGFASSEQVSATEQALAQVQQLLGYDSIVLAGGRGSRLDGRDKPALKLAGWPLVDHVLLSCGGATSRIVVSPPRRTLTQAQFCREDPPGAGPLAAIAAGAALVDQPLVALLAADLPFAQPALGALRTALLASDADAAVLIEPSARVNYLAAMWRSDRLARALDALGEVTNQPVRLLYDNADLSYVDDFDGWGTDCDTWADLHAATERIKPRSRERLPAMLLAWPRLELYSPS